MLFVSDDDAETIAIIAMRSVKRSLSDSIGYVRREEERSTRGVLNGRMGGFIGKDW